MAYPEMDSKEDDSTGRKSFHRVPSSKGSVSTVRVGSRRVPLYPLAIVCLGLLNTILLLTAVVIGIYCGKLNDASSPEQMSASILLMEVQQLRFVQSGAVQAQMDSEEALEKQRSSTKQDQQQIEESKTLSDGLQRQLEKLHIEKATQLSLSSDTRLSCGRCLTGWFFLNESCYLHSQSETNTLKTWADSREDCIQRGGDLAVIEDSAEQFNLYHFLPKPTTQFRQWWQAGTGIWIGLTRQPTDTWMWVNNATLLGEGFWIQGQPDNKGPLGEKCGAIINMADSKHSWFDGYCPSSKEWLCEMGPR